MNPTDPHRCPTCGQPIAGPPTTAETLRDWCEANGRHVTADGCVYEDVAAELIDRAPGTLSNWRCNGGGDVPYYHSGRTGRVRYKIIDLAAYNDKQLHD